jgi:T5orf172 domain.
MTRRLDPQERIDELGSASVPFAFDVHSFIFSNDASTLETELHRRLNDRRVNKVNKRKEFFSVSLDELEALVNEIYPSAEFNRTMMAEEYRQSLSLTENAFSFDDDNSNVVPDDEDSEEA